MKKLLLPVLFLLVLTACSKQDAETVAPDAVSIVSGTYPMNYYRLDSADVKSETNLPYIVGGMTVASGTMTVTQGVLAGSVNLKYHLVVSGSDDENLDFGDYTLQPSGNSYNLYKDTTQYGTVDGTNLNYNETFTGTDKAVYRLIINAAKVK